MARRHFKAVGALLALVWMTTAAPVFAVVEHQLGDRDFDQGMRIDNISGPDGFTDPRFQGAEPAPFGQFRGDDGDAALNQPFMWTHTFDPDDFADDMLPDGLGGFTTGFNFLSIEVGLYDHDTQSAGAMNIEQFTLNGVDISELAGFYFDNNVTTFGTPAGDDKQYDVYRFLFDIDDDIMGPDGKPATKELAEMIAATSEFQNGQLDVVLALRGPSLVVSPDPNSGNGFGVDYSFLRINTPAGDDISPRVVPEPASATLGVLSLAALMWRGRRRR